MVAPLYLAILSAPPWALMALSIRAFRSPASSARRKPVNARMSPRATTPHRLFRMANLPERGAPARPEYTPPRNQRGRNQAPSPILFAAGRGPFEPRRAGGGYAANRMATTGRE